MRSPAILPAAAAALLCAARLGAVSTPVPVSPGELHGLAAVPGPCPTFSWVGLSEARSYELLVLPAETEGLLPAGMPALRQRLPAGAATWTPPLARCLAPGRRYAWLLRAETDQGGTPWSEALLFEVPAVAAAELARALEIVAAALGEDPARLAALVGTEPASAGESEEARGTPDEASAQGAPLGAVTAVRGEVPDAAGVTFGVVGLSHSPDGAGVVAENFDVGGVDLLLGGSPGAELTEAGLSREASDNVSFDFANPGSGTMTLLVDGQGVLTAGTDDWVNETGDTMSGTLVLSPGGGNHALVTTSGRVGIGTGAPSQPLDVNGNANLGGSLFQAGTLFLHDNGPQNTALGENALLAVTTGAENTAVGYQALDANTTASSNTAVGVHALGGNTTGNGNTAVGRLALFANTVGIGNTGLGYRALSDNTASGNTAVGTNALRSNSSGTGNTALGRSALAANTTALNNTAVGSYALDVNTSGSHNTAVGRNALGANTSGLFNTAVGAATLEDNTAGGGNTAAGYRALQNNSTGANNTAIGISALVSNTDGLRNAALGAYALLLNTGGDDQTAVGYNALLFNTTGSRNTAVGHDALRDNTTGMENVAVGQRALANNTTGHDNIAIGRYAGLNLDTGSENIHIGHQGVAGEGNRIRIGTTGDQNQTFIAGIHGVTVSPAAAVFAKSDGQLGTRSCGTYLSVVSGFCPFDVAGCGVGPPCDRVPAGSMCESDGECGLDNELNNCGCIIGDEQGDWYLRLE